jgi:hypothetical protein
MYESLIQSFNHITWQLLCVIFLITFFMVFSVFSAQPTSHVDFSIDIDMSSVEHLPSNIVVLFNPGHGERCLGAPEFRHQVDVRLVHLLDVLEEFRVNIDGLTASLFICGFDLRVDGTFVRTEGVDAALAVSLGSAAAAKDLVDILHGHRALFVELEQDMSILGQLDVYSHGEPVVHPDNSRVHLGERSLEELGVLVSVASGRIDVGLLTPSNQGVPQGLIIRTVKQEEGLGLAFRLE